MPRSLTFSSLLAVCLLVLSFMATSEADSSGARVASPSRGIAALQATLPEPELHNGAFSAFRVNVTDPIAYVWSYESSGQQYEVWALYDPGNTNGWTFPGPSATSVAFDVDYQSSGSAFSTITDFADWCVGHHSVATQYSDFEFHLHVVSVVTP